MKRCNLKVPVEVTMENGDVTESYDPLGMFSEPAEINCIYNSYGAVTSPGTHNRLNLRIVEHLLEIAPA
jgi:hypothetical protein